MYVYKDIFEAAKAYSQKGWAVFPFHSLKNGVCSCGRANCDKAAKHPMTLHGVKDATTDAAKVVEYFGSDSPKNIAMATGEPSGVFVIDVDDLGSLDVLEKENGKLPPTPIVLTGSGRRHYFFKFDERCKTLKNSVKFAGSLDVRTTGGAVVLPPSIHASGNEYRWLVTPEQIPFASAPDWLLELIPKRDDRMLPLVASSRGATTSSEKPTVELKSVPLSTYVIEKARTEKDRAIIYLQSCPPAIQGDGGQNTTFRICCYLIEAFGNLSDDELIEVLKYWNERCVPSWTEKDLRRKLTEARKKTRRKTTNTPCPSLNSSDDVSEPVIVDDWPTLDDDALHGLAGDIVNRILPHSECDAVALLLTLLGAYGVSVGRSPFFMVEGSKHHANEFICIIGKSSKARKGTSFGRIVEVFRGTNMLAPCVSGLSSGEGLIDKVADPSFVKKDGEYLSKGGVDDKRLFVQESEFARVLKVAKREGNTISAILREAWDTGTLRVLTKGNPLTATDAHIGLLVHITIDEFRKTLAETDIHNGFFNRFLFALVRRSKLLPDGGGDLFLDDLRERLTTTIVKASSIESMERSEDCKSLWHKVYEELCTEKEHGLYDAATSRAEAHTLRLSMLYALLDGSPIIEVEHLKAALAVWRYCDDSASIIFGNVQTTSKNERRIVELVTSSPGIMRSEIARALPHSLKASELDMMLQRLVKRGSIVCVPVYDERQAETYYKGLGNWGLGGTISEAKPIPAIPAIPQEILTEIENANPSNPAIPQAATLSELLNFRNQNACDFIVREDGTYWLSTDLALPPEIEAALTVHASALKPFVRVNAWEPPDDGNVGEWYASLDDANKKLFDAKYDIHFLRDLEMPSDPLPEPDWKHPLNG